MQTVTFSVCIGHSGNPSIVLGNSKLERLLSRSRGFAYQNTPESGVASLEIKNCRSYVLIELRCGSKNTLC
ncbi:MAG: hypothetical protein HC780_10710 [Leptolyngbyaceae cyanobacterium CSU_1_3]|nr:hypothetical protein [Leptolyngbyaceae cyanobacterium CSU_1_3]